MKIKLDVDQLTFGDIEDFEAHVGGDLMAAISGATSGTAPLKAMIGLIWICQRTIDPDFTLEDARKVKVSELEVEVAEADPTPGSG